MKNLSSIFTVVVLLAVTILLSSSRSVMTPTTCPNNPKVTVTTDNANYITAVAMVKGAHDGIEWTITGGFIISGVGTNTLSLGRDCPSGYVTACARAFINQSGGGICYSAEICGGVDYTGPCFY